jgi:hypothetical protein
VGTDVNGWLEAQSADSTWRAAVALYPLYDSRDYDAFGCLFGVRNYAGFRPLADQRGLPDDAAAETRAAYAEDDEFFGATWLAWSELATVDWSEPAVQPDARVHQYRLEPDGTETYVGKASWSADLAALTGVTLADQSRDGIVVHPEGTAWRSGDTVFRVERLTRAEVIGGWTPVFAELEQLAQEGRDSRVVVWFDQ